MFQLLKNFKLQGLEGLGFTAQVYGKVSGFGGLGFSNADRQEAAPATGPSTPKP